MTIETRLRNTGQQGGAGGGSSDSGGLAGTGGFYVAWSSDLLLSNEKVLTAGSSVIVRTDATAIYVDALTSASASSGGLASTGGFYVTYIADATLSNERILVAGSSVIVRTDATSIYVDALTGGGSSVVYAPTNAFYVVQSANPTLTNEFVLVAGSSIIVRTDATSIYVDAITNGLGAGSFSILPQQAKLYANDSSARIDAGTSVWRLLYSATTQQYGIWQFSMPPDYGTSPYIRIMWGVDSGLSVARSVSWIVEQWGWSPFIANSSIYIDTYGGANTVAVALSAGHSSGNLQMLTIPLTTTVSLAVNNLIRLRISGSGGFVGNAEYIGGHFGFSRG